MQNPILPNLSIQQFVIFYLIFSIIIIFAVNLAMKKLRYREGNIKLLDITPLDIGYLTGIENSKITTKFAETAIFSLQQKNFIDLKNSKVSRKEPAPRKKEGVSNLGKIEDIVYNYVLANSTVSISSIRKYITGKIDKNIGVVRRRLEREKIILDKDEINSQKILCYIGIFLLLAPAIARLIGSLSTDNIEFPILIVAIILSIIYVILNKWRTISSFGQYIIKKIKEQDSMDLKIIQTSQLTPSTLAKIVAAFGISSLKGITPAALSETSFHKEYEEMYD
jgi:uncharacterized protein (TIGR04222 family)